MPSQDKSGRMNSDFTAPARGAIAITLSDTDQSVFVRAFYVGTAGHVKVTTMEGEDITFSNAVGIIPVACKRFWSTGTTASNIVGLY